MSVLDLVPRVQRVQKEAAINLEKINLRLALSMGGINTHNIHPKDDHVTFTTACSQ